MREADKNNVIKPVSGPVCAAERQYEAAAVVAGGRKGERLYFPVNFDVAPSNAARQSRTAHDAAERDACISLLFPKTSSLGRPGRRQDHQCPERHGLYFPVNSRAASAARPTRVGGDAYGATPDCLCKNLQIVADAHAPAVGEPCETQFALLREIAAFA